jgi:outer membrane receptor protein involved in Fe transport
VIDWVRATPEERWHTANVRHVRSLGLEISARRRLGESGDVGVSYTYLDSRARQLDLLSKYLLDFARHSSGVQLHLGLPAGLALGQTACYRHYSDGRNAVVVNVRLSRGIGPVRVWADARNLLDSLTPEIRGVDVPGRAFTFGLELKTAARP